MPEKGVITKPPSKPPRKHPRKHPRILVVDDEAIVSKALARILSSHNYEVQTASSGGKALEIYERERFDLLITDFNMPGMDGNEFIRRVRKLNPRQRVIVITGVPSLKSKKEAFELGALNYIAKPVIVADLLGVVSNALEAKKKGRVCSS